jgi:CDP-paratose 2-epimerase
VGTALITGSGGLIGAESVRHFAEAGYDVVGIDNDLRARFFGPSGSTRPANDRLLATYPDYRLWDVDIRDEDAVDTAFANATGVELIVHAAAQPSHDWSAANPRVDFAINAVGTMNLLEAARRHSPDATFIFASTNKVYGDRPNRLPVVELHQRFDLPDDHPFFEGVDTSMSVDRSLHSPFGASKVAADLMVQEYGRYFDMPTGCFRCGCLTGPSHAGVELHGFLSYLMRCTVTGERYTVLGYGGKQVRDNLHSGDVVAAFAAFHEAPRKAAVYNLGGGRKSNCSMLEAIAACSRISGSELDWQLRDDARKGDHRWWISDVGPFRRDYPAWDVRHDVEGILREIHDQNAERWLTSRGPRSS